MSDTHAFRHVRRRKRTDHELARIFLDRGGRCHVCGRKLRSGDHYQIDHIIALEIGGTDADENLAPCCDWCHRQKTAKDHAKAAKGRAIAVAHVIPPSQRQSKWPPIPGSKRSRFKKRFDGTVEFRREK